VESKPVPDSAPVFARFEVRDLFNIARQQAQIPWKPFKGGVDIHRLYGDGVTGPTAALLRFREAAKLPLHQHNGYEHILVLSGSQRDQNGAIEAGTLAINPPGTAHSVTCDAGCIVLAIYEKPVSWTPSS
jgi:anti-sigma factor ChrR (cupin superfamily)